MGFLAKLFSSSGKETKQKSLLTNWNTVYNENQIKQIIKESYTQPQLLFKHSTRCGISRMALTNFERDFNWDNQEIKMHFLDVLLYRDVSNAAAEILSVKHESPQVILVKDGKAIYNASHGSISAKAIEEYL